MYFLSLLAMCMKRSYDLLSAASVAMMLMLAENVFLLFDTAFQLSFGAIIGMALFGPVFQRLLGFYGHRSMLYSGRENRVKRKLNDLILCFLKGISVSLAIQAVTLPIVLNSYYEIPCYGVLINLLVIPLMGVLLATGLAGGAVGMIVLFGKVAEVVLKIPCVILMLYESLSRWSTFLPGNMWIVGKPQIWQILLYYSFLVVCLCLIGRVSEKFEKLIIGGMAVLAVFLILIKTTGDFEVHTLSVGQGDSNVIFGKDMPVVLIDSGSADVREVGKYRLVPFLKANAVSQVDYVFLSHMDTDHVSGVIELLSEDFGIKVRNIIVPKSAALKENPSENYIELSRLASLKKIPVYLMESGDCLSFCNGNVSIACLSPTVTNENLWQRMDDNDNSLVLSVSYVPEKFRALFTGDISADVETRILNCANFQQELLDVQYLKAAHHGSRFSTTEGLLDATNPLCTVISCGEDNMYGHPHKETLERLAETGSRVLRTDQCGEINVKITDDGIRLGTFLDDITYYQ